MKIIGFEADSTLPAPQRATLLMCKFYVQFQAGENWSQVRRELQNEGVKPIAADAILLERKVEECFNTARSVKREQMTLSEESKGEEIKKEDSFFNAIMLQRDQEIRQEQIKRSAKAPKSMQTWKAEKEARAKMLANSMMQSSPAAEEPTATIDMAPSGLIGESTVSS